MEDYEKKYKDALERAKKALQYNGALVTSIFPELGEEKEIGDEKTLDRIYNFISLSKDVTLPGVDADRMLSWLEKMKHEQKTVSKIPVSEKLYDSIKNVCACIDDVMSSEALVDITDYIEQANKNAQEAFDMIEKRENSLWNENDEKNVRNILYILNQLKGTSKCKEDKTAENCIDWIESIKNRFIV